MIILKDKQFGRVGYIKFNDKTFSRVYKFSQKDNYDSENKKIFLTFYSELEKKKKEIKELLFAAVSSYENSEIDNPKITAEELKHDSEVLKYFLDHGPQIEEYCRSSIPREARSIIEHWAKLNDEFSLKTEKRKTLYSLYNNKGNNDAKLKAGQLTKDLSKLKVDTYSIGEIAQITLKKYKDTYFICQKYEFLREVITKNDFLHIEFREKDKDEKYYRKEMYMAYVAAGRDIEGYLTNKKTVGLIHEARLFSSIIAMKEELNKMGVQQYSIAKCSIQFEGIEMLNDKLKNDRLLQANSIFDKKLLEERLGTANNKTGKITKV